MNSKALVLFALLLTLRLPAADLPDVTLQPWSVRSINFGPGSFGSTHALTGTNGLVLLYNGSFSPQLSIDFGETWTKVPGADTVLDYISSDSTAYTGNGYFLSQWYEPAKFEWVQGITNPDGERLRGYNKMAFGGGLLVGVESYSTYVSPDKGTTWTPYLNPFSADGVSLVSFNRIFYDGARFVAVNAKGTFGYTAFQGSTWRSADGVSWHLILKTNAVSMDSQGRLVAAIKGNIYDLVGDSLVAAHAEFPTAEGNIDYHRVENRVYVAKDDLLYYSDDKGVTRYRTGFPATIEAIWTRPNKSDDKHVVEVLIVDKRVFASIPVVPIRAASPVVTLDSIEMRPMLTFEASIGTTVIIEASSSPGGGWTEVARVSATGGKQVWNDNRDLAVALFYRARSQ